MFTNVSFLREIETRKSSFRRLKHLLILLARMLALACLAIAFAQPYLKKEEKEGALEGITSLYVDNSFSMQNEENNKRFIDIATGALDELLTVYNNLTSLQLVTNDFSSEEYGLFTASGIQDRLTSTGLTPATRTLEEVYTRQKRLMNEASNGLPGSVYWISDFQKSTAGDMTRLPVDSADRLNLIPVQAKDIKNVYVDSVWLQTPFLREQQKNVLHVKIRNSGNEPVENLPVRLILNDTQVSASSVDIPAGTSESIRFDFSPGAQGHIRGMIGFDDFPVTFDNRFYFVLSASPVLKILHLHSGSQAASDPVDRVYRNDSLFRVTAANAGNVDVGQAAVSDLVILNGIGRPSAQLMSAILEFVNKGGSLLIIPPDRPDESAYGPYLEQMKVYGLKSREAGPVPLNAPDAGIPFFGDVFDTSLKSDGQVNMPAAASVWQWSNTGNTLLSLRNGQQFLAQTSVGQGKLYLLGAPLDGAGGNFAQHALFVPVMYKIAALSVRDQRTSYSFDDRTIELNVSDPAPNTVYKLKNGETEIIPGQRLLGDRLILEVPRKADLPGQPLEPGYFELGAGDKTENLIALNLGKTESELAYYSADELREIFAGKSNVKVFDRIENSDLRTRFDRQTSGTRLWKYFLYAALAFLLAEILLVRLMKD